MMRQHLTGAKRALWLTPLLFAAPKAGADPGVRPALRPEPAAHAAGSLAPAPIFPPAIVTGQPTTLKVPGDKPLYVIHAPAEITRAIVYLHGWCGRVEAPESFKQ
ncbi:MAG TPA: hypothetical protein VGP93_04505, partial [Polyangiaceae bacterium]|nr:hypothetical protein [Polyangiaceae bacterium]